jgi:hypothetical protein
VGSEITKRSQIIKHLQRYYFSGFSSLEGKAEGVGLPKSRKQTHSRRCLILDLRWPKSIEITKRSQIIEDYQRVSFSSSFSPDPTNGKALHEFRTRSGPARMECP